MERLMIEPHVLHISAEAITPELLRREEKLQEKQRLLDLRQKEKLERLSRKVENNNSATSSRSSSVDENAEESDSRTSSLSTSRSATPIMKNGIVPKSRALESREKSNKRKAGVHLPNSYNESKKARIASILPHKLAQTNSCPNVTLRDTILIRLSSGQLIRVPKSTIKQVATATGRSNSNDENIQITPHNVIKSSLISSKTSTEIQSEPRTQLKTNATSHLSLTEKNLSYAPISTPFASRLSEALKQLSCQNASSLDMDSTNDNQSNILNGIHKKLDDSGQNGTNDIKCITIRAFQGNSDRNIQNARKDFGVGKLSQQLKKIEQKLAQNALATVQVPGIGVAKGSQPQMLMMSGGGNVTRVVIPKWLNVTVAPNSKGQRNVVSLSPSKQTQNIIRIRGPLPARSQSNALQSSLLNLSPAKSTVTAGSSLLLKDDIKSSQITTSMLQNVPIHNSAPLKLLSGGSTRTFVTDMNGVLKNPNSQDLRVIQQQSPIIFNNIANNTTVVNTLFKDTSGSPIVIKKSLVSANHGVPLSAPTLFNVSNNPLTTSNATTYGSTNDINTVAASKNSNNVVIVENVNSAKEPINSFLKVPYASTRQISPHKSSVPAVVMVSKVDHNSTSSKTDIAPSATSVISSSNPIPGEVEFYDKEL